MSSVSAGAAGRSVMVCSPVHLSLFPAAGGRPLEHEVTAPAVVRLPALGVAVSPDLLAPCDQPLLELARVLEVRRVDLVPSAVALGDAPLRIQVGELAAFLIAQHAPGMLAIDDRPADVAEAVMRLVAVRSVHVLDGGEALLSERPVGLDVGAVLREPGLDL